MPTYDYQCDACSHEFELFQRISEDPVKKCPECKKNKLRRLFGTGAAIVFKGSGFYETDYRSESYKKGAESAKKSMESKSDSSSDSKSESKPAAKSNSKSASKTDSGASSKPAKNNPSKDKK